MSFKHLWQIIKKKDEFSTTKAIIKPVKSEEEKAVELEERRNDAELNKMRLYELKRERFKSELESLGKQIQGYSDEFEDEDYDDEGDGDLDEITGLLQPILGALTGGGQALSNGQENITPLINSNINAQQATMLPSPNISDEEIRGYLRQQKKKNLVLAKTIPKQLLKRKISEHLPMTDQEFERAYQILIEEF